MLTAERAREALHYDPEAGTLTWRINGRGYVRAGRRAGTQNTNGYRYLSLDNHRNCEHRVIWLWMTGAFPAAVIDHKNRVKNDNRWGNLRAATLAQNLANQAPRPGLTKGVQFDPRSNCWYAHGHLNRRMYNLGTFKTEAEAAARRKAWAEEHYGEFACEGRAA